MSSTHSQLPKLLQVDFPESFTDFRNPVDIRLRVAGKDFFLNTQGRPSLSLMLPAFASFGVACLHVAEKYRRAVLDLDNYGEEILFQREGSHLFMCSTITQASVQVPSDAFFVEWKAFVIYVKHIVTANLPGKSSYPGWDFIDGQISEVVAQELTRDQQFFDTYGCFEKDDRE